MFAHQLEFIFKKYDIHYGWFMAAIAFMYSLFSSAALSTPQILILPIVENFGWKISDISNSIAVMYIILASVAPFGSALMLRFGVSNIVSISGFLIVLGLFSTTFVNEKWHLFGTIGICLGLASGMMGLGLSATVATRWFSKRRGLVVGILTSSFAAGQLIFLPFMAWLTTVYDWRVAVLPPLLGAGFCTVLFLLFGKNWPSELSLPPFGDKNLFNPPKPSKENAIFISFKNLFMAMKYPTFWMLTISFFICGLTSSGLVGQHFIPFCSDNNVGIVLAASYLAIMGIFNFIGTMGSGYLSDRYNNYYLLAIYYSLRGLSLIWLPYSNFDAFSLTIWAVFFGLDFIATVPPTIRLTSKFFGMVNGPIVFGWIFASHQYGSAVAAYGAGLIRDTIQDYFIAFISAGLSCFIASILIIFFRNEKNLVNQN